MFAGDFLRSYRMLAALHCRRATCCKDYASSTMEKKRKEKEKRKSKEKNRTEQNRTERNRTEQNRTERNRTEQNRTERNGTEQNGTEQKTKQKAYAFWRQLIEKAKYNTGLPRNSQQCKHDAATTATWALQQKGNNNMRKTGCRMWLRAQTSSCQG